MACTAAEKISPTVTVSGGYLVISRIAGVLETVIISVKTASDFEKKETMASVA